jgi:hypothetical protein
VAPSGTVHAPELTILARFGGPTPSLFASPDSQPLGAPAAAVTLAVGTLTPDRSFERDSASRRHAHGHSPRSVEAPQPGPFTPNGPEGPNSFAAAASGPGGGAAFVFWCAVVVGFVIYAARPLRRHVLPSVVFAPTAFVSLLQRPG